MPAISAHNSQFAALCLRKKYNQIVLSRSFSKAASSESEGMVLEVYVIQRVQQNAI